MMMWIAFLSLFILTVLTEQDEVSRGYVGENVTMEFSKPSKLSFLYHFDKRIAIIQECECRLFPGTPFAGRQRCSQDKISTKCTIIIQNVTQRDAGIYKIVREDTVIERRFLNITVSNNTSTMNKVAPDARSAETQLHSISTCSQASSLSKQSTTNRVSTPEYVIPVVIGVVGVVMLMIGFLIWMQRRNTYNLDTVQRLILEKCDTASFSTPTTVRSTVLMPALEKGRTDRSVPRVKALHDVILGLYCSATPRNAASVDTLYSSIYSLEKCVADKPKDDNMFCCNESTERSNTLFSTGDESTEKEILGECPSVCIQVSTLGREEYRKICTVQREVAKNIQAMFEKANDEPTISSKYYRRTRTIC
ncbi:hypothetical protein CHS0354_014730 [Potamilus streckersoni]|uniref:Uncharacterized protein n=1 Tax=Potamilus streckersoni TaxID=2493646 RepID=A0AAE0SPL5_9BIVA|nr:hypothetical protein CHS0354_014730 [Potamilus streckersoni]